MTYLAAIFKILHYNFTLKIQFAIEGEKWKRLRNSLSPTFTSGKMKQMFHIINDKGKELINYIERIRDAGDPVYMKDLAQRFTAEVVSSSAFGLECHALTNRDEPEIIKLGNEVVESTGLTALYFFFVSSFPNISRQLRLKMFKNNVTNYFMSIIKENASHREQNNVHRKDFFNMILSLKNRGTIFDEKPEDDEAKITFNEMAAQAFVFFFAGFDTSSTAISFALYFVAKHPEIQIRLREEVKRVKEKHGGLISYDALMDMHYLNQVLNETLRLYPPAAVLFRIASADYSIPETNLILPKGHQIIIPVYGIHRDPDIYPNPENFDPDRFSTEENQKRHPYAYIPFGEGPRNCIGMRFAQLQSKFGIATLVDNYELLVNSKTQEPLTLDKGNPNMVVKGYG